MSDWTLRPAVPDDFPRLVEVLNLTDPRGTTLEQFRRSDERRDPSLPFVRLVAQAPDGTVAGYGLAGKLGWLPPGAYLVRIAIDPSLWGRGAGRALYGVLEQQGRDWGATRLDATVRDNRPEARAWLERRSFALAHHAFESELDLTTFDPAPFFPAVDAARARGYEFRTMADMPGPEAQRRLWELDMECSRDAPASSPEDWVAEPFEPYARNVFEVPDYDPSGVYVALKDGDWAGMSGLHFPPEQDRAWTFFTGVRRAHRGQGLAQALKVLAIDYARRKGYRRVGTGNHSLNAGMLAINWKMGFKQLPGEYYMRKRL